MNREKAEILIVGSFDDEGYPIEWYFDLRKIPAIAIDEANGVLFGGWTPGELREYAADHLEGNREHEA